MIDALIIGTDTTFCRFVLFMILNAFLFNRVLVLITLLSTYPFISVLLRAGCVGFCLSIWCNYFLCLFPPVRYCSYSAH